MTLALPSRVRSSRQGTQRWVGRGAAVPRARELQGLDAGCKLMGWERMGAHGARGVGRAHLAFLAAPCWRGEAWGRGGFSLLFTQPCQPCLVVLRFPGCMGAPPCVLHTACAAHAPPHTRRAQGLAHGRCLPYIAKGDAALEAWVRGLMFVPVYSSLVHLPQGVGE